MPWAGHRRSVSSDKIPWVGWNNPDGLGMLDLVEKCATEEQELYLVTYFSTGCREDEGIELRPEMVSWNKDMVTLTAVKVEKYYEYIRDLNNKRTLNPEPQMGGSRKKKYLTKPITVTRNIDIPRKHNLVADRLVQMVEKCHTKYLLPRHKQFTGAIDPERHTSGQNVYNKIVAIDKRIWPHWVRSQTVSFLIDECGLDPYQIQAWFHWSSLDISTEYFAISRRKRAKMWGVKKMPSMGERSG